MERETRLPEGLRRQAPEAPDPLERAAGAATAGLRGLSAPDVERLVAMAADDADPRARAAAVAAIARGAPPAVVLPVWSRAAGDADPAVRRRAAEVAPAARDRQVEPGDLVALLVDLLADHDVTVVEAGAWALGELGKPAVAAGGGRALARVAVEHPDLLAREAAVGALGALGDPDTLPAVLAACSDRTTVRRRAVLALAPFEGADVQAALKAARNDKDWQVRQAAEDLLGN